MRAKLPILSYYPICNYYDMLDEYLDEMQSNCMNIDNVLVQGISDFLRKTLRPMENYENEIGEAYFNTIAYDFRGLNVTYLDAQTGDYSINVEVDFDNLLDFIQENTETEAKWSKFFNALNSINAELDYLEIEDEILQLADELRNPQNNSDDEFAEDSILNISNYSETFIGVILLVSVMFQYDDQDFSRTHDTICMNQELEPEYVISVGTDEESNQEAIEYINSEFTFIPKLEYGATALSELEYNQHYKWDNERNAFVLDGVNESLKDRLARLTL